MKMFKKILVACAAITSLTLALTASAFAANTLDVSYSAGKVSIEGELPTDGQQITVIVIPADADDGSIDADEILYIDQTAAAAGVFQLMGVKGGTLANGDYIVKVGGENIDGGILVGGFTVGTTAPTYKLGDSNLNDVVDSTDAANIMSHDLGLITLTGDALKAADANKSGNVDSTDAADVMSHDLGLITLVW